MIHHLQLSPKIWRRSLLWLAGLMLLVVSHTVALAQDNSWKNIAWVAPNNTTITARQKVTITWAHNNLTQYYFIDAYTPRGNLAGKSFKASDYCSGSTCNLSLNSLWAYGNYNIWIVPWRAGQWGNWKSGSFKMDFLPVTLNQPKTYVFSSADENLRLTWNPQIGVGAYRLDVYNGRGQRIYSNEFSGNWCGNQCVLNVNDENSGGAYEVWTIPRTGGAYGKWKKNTFYVWRQTALSLTLNRHRCQRGLQPISVDPRLYDVDLAHAQDMAAYDYVNYVGRNNSTPFSRANAAGYTGTVINAAYAGGKIFYSEDAFAQYFINTYGNGAFFLRGDVTEIGGAWAYNKNGNYDNYWHVSYGKRNVTRPNCAQLDLPEADNSPAPDIDLSGEVVAANTTDEAPATVTEPASTITDGTLSVDGVQAPTDPLNGGLVEPTPVPELLTEPIDVMGASAGE